MLPYTESGIASCLRTDYVGRRLVFLQSTSSTQNVAKTLAADGAPDGTVVLADSQTAGRGRLGRSWVAPPGTSVLLSLISRPTLAPSQIHRLTMLCSLAVVDAVAVVAGLRVGIKWPNDVVTWPTAQQPESRKLAGLLAESSLVGERVSYCVVGIGINVNLELSELPPTIVPATSLRAETARAVDRTALLCEMLANVERRYRGAETRRGRRRRPGPRVVGEPGNAGQAGGGHGRRGNHRGGGQWV